MCERAGHHGGGSPAVRTGRDCQILDDSSGLHGGAMLQRRWTVPAALYSMAVAAAPWLDGSGAVRRMGHGD
jgi:hypothetical protein